MLAEHEQFFCLTVISTAGRNLSYNQVDILSINEFSRFAREDSVQRGDRMQMKAQEARKNSTVLSLVIAAYAEHEQFLMPHRHFDRREKSCCCFRLMF